MPPLQHATETPVRVATIFDQFTQNSFQHEFHGIPIEPKNWSALFEEHDPQVLFCESTWAGLDLIRRPWEGEVHACSNPGGKRTLNEILAHCKKRGIPTVFWNKEDPVFYKSPLTDFSATAAKFDVIFTSAEECVSHYRRDYGRRAHVLPFAANQNMFNPVAAGSRSSKLIFAGSWYPAFPQRVLEMEKILDHFAFKGFGIEIYARWHGENNALNDWPAKYACHLRPGVPHAGIASVYKSSRFGLNFNTVVDSPTMFARRTYELMACNTLVISNYARGMDELFGDLAIYADREPDRLMQLSDRDINALRQEALLRVLKFHTYAHRWRTIRDALGMPKLSMRVSIAWFCPVHSPSDCADAVARFRAGEEAAELAGLVLLALPPLSTSEVEALPGVRGDSQITFATLDDAAAALSHFSADSFLLAGVDTLPRKQWIRNAKLHLSYMRSHALTTAAGTRYQFMPRTVGQPLLGDCSLLAASLTPSHTRLQRVYPV